MPLNQNDRVIASTNGPAFRQFDPFIADGKMSRCYSTFKMPWLLVVSRHQQTQKWHIIYIMYQMCFFGSPYALLVLRLKMMMYCEWIVTYYAGYIQMVIRYVSTFSMEQFNKNGVSSYWCWALQWRPNECDSVSNHQPTIVYSTVYSSADQRKHQSSASLAFVRGIHWWPLNFSHKGQ